MSIRTPTAIGQHGCERVLRETEAYRQRIADVLTKDSTLGDNAVLTEFDIENITRDINGLNETVGERGLAHTLAEAGLLPMYGMPTRVRNLYLGDRSTEDGTPWRTWKTIDRDLDVAVYEFAPGSVLVKDKQRHLCIGFTGDLPNFVGTRRRVNLSPLGPAFSPPFWIVQCNECGAWARFDRDPVEDEIRCASCTHLLDSTMRSECRTPNGFRTDFRPRTIEEEALTSRRHRAITAEGTQIRLNDIPGSNLLYLDQTQTRTYRLNRGAWDEEHNVWMGFDATVGEQAARRYRLHEQYIANDQERLRDFQPDPARPGVEAIWLAAPKTTDSLFLGPSVVPDGLRTYSLGLADNRDTAVRAAAISATFILVLRASMDLDIAPEEFDIVEPRNFSPWWRFSHSTASDHRPSCKRRWLL